jgi:RNA polymerase sigma-70 factor (ECF subfamily)
MQTAIAALPGEQREVILLIALEQLSYSEVSKALDIPIGTVMSRLFRARERLRAQLGAVAPPSNLKLVR